jgi:RHS repeat-associated protein
MWVFRGVTTQYLIDDLSPTGYSQVVEELVSGAVTRKYTYGRQRISELQSVSGSPTVSFFQYDGRGTVRMLTSSTGSVTDTYEYDAFGNLIHATGSTPNAYLYRGERYDSDLGLYYLRARWYNPATGRFMTRDPYSGSIFDPASLHRYNYARSNPVNFIDPSGRSSLVETALNLTLKGVAVTGIGYAVKCAFSALWSAEFLTGKTMGQQVKEFGINFGNCSSAIKADEFARAALANTLLLGVGQYGLQAFEGLGNLLSGAEVGGIGFAESGGLTAESAAAAAEGTPSLGPSLGSYSAIESGPLPDKLADTFSGGRYNVVQLQEDTTLYRAGTSDQPFGQYFSADPPMSEIQARIDSAIMPEWPDGALSPIDTVFAINFPRGTLVYIGEASSQGGIYVGGTQQFLIPNAWTIPGVEVIGSIPLI